MPIQVNVCAQGSHSTPIDLVEYKSLLLESIGHIKIEEVVELQLRHVHLPRRSYGRKVHVVSYGTTCRRSIDLDMYDGSATGRPAKLFCRTDECMALVLRALSAQKYESWEEFLKRDQEIGSLNYSGQEKKLLERAKTNDEAKFRKNICSLLRKRLHEGKGVFSIRILEKFKVGMQVEGSDLLNEVGVGGNEEHDEDAILFLEQFGLLNRIKGGKNRVEITSHVVDFANALIERLNKQDDKVREKEYVQLEKKLAKVQEEEEKYFKLFKECEARKKSLKWEVVKKEFQKPKPLELYGESGR